MYFDTIPNNTKQELYQFLDTIKEDFQIAHPSNLYLSDVLTIYINNMIDTLIRYIKTPKHHLYDRFERYLYVCLNFTEGTSKLFLEILLINLNILKDLLIDIEYYETLELIDNSIENISISLSHIS